MRRAAIILACLAVAGTATASDRDTVLESLGALSIAPQLCGIDVDRDALQATGRELLPEEPELAVATFRVNNRIASESAAWSETELVAFCDASSAVAERLGILR